MQHGDDSRARRRTRAALVLLGLVESGVSQVGFWLEQLKYQLYERDGRFNCLDCGIDTIDEYYSVWDDVWLRANPSGDGMLCIGCLERRLGRRLTALDFTAAPINFERRGPRVRERICE